MSVYICPLFSVILIYQRFHCKITTTKSWQPYTVFPAHSDVVRQEGKWSAAVPSNWVLHRKPEQVSYAHRVVINCTIT